MAKPPRSRNAIRRASFGRAERLRREAGDRPQAKPARTKTRSAARQDARTPREEDRERPARAPARERKPTPLHRAQERIERADAAAERQRLGRLEQQTRTDFNRAGERRRDQAGRIEHDRKREALQAKERRIADNRKKTDQRQRDRRREQARREFSRAAEDRRARLLAERQKDLQRRAAADVERDQKRAAENQKAEQRRQQDQVRGRQKAVRHSFRVNEDTAMERHHHAVKGIDAREARELAEFDGRRRGLAGRAAEMVPGRRAENDRQRAEMVRGYEAERLAKHRDLEAFKERSFQREMQTRRDQARELKELRAMHRDERAAQGRNHEVERPRLIEGRARVIECTERTQEQTREQTRQREDQSREQGRPSDDFARAAASRSEPALAPREVRQESREMVRPTHAFGRT